VPKILVVDDAADIRDVARTALERLGGWEVVTAASGPEALGLVVDSRFDAVVLDLAMPGMDGLETLRRLRAGGDPAVPPVVLLTAGRIEPDAAELSRLGVVGLVPKPFDPLLLSEQIAALLGSG
jgi:CheY-like chemotaxis protein